MKLLIKYVCMWFNYDFYYNSWCKAPLLAEVVEIQGEFNRGTHMCFINLEKHFYNVDIWILFDLNGKLSGYIQTSHTGLMYFTNPLQYIHVHNIMNGKLYMTQEFIWIDTRFSVPLYANKLAMITGDMDHFLKGSICTSTRLWKIL